MNINRLRSCATSRINVRGRVQSMRPLRCNKPIMHNVDLERAHEAYNVCHVIDDSDEQKEECYAFYGVDGELTEKYIHIVQEFETSFNMVDSYDSTRQGDWNIFGVNISNPFASNNKIDPDS